MNSFFKRSICIVYEPTDEFTNLIDFIVETENKRFNVRKSGHIIEMSNDLLEVTIRPFEVSMPSGRFDEIFLLGYNTSHKSFVDRILSKLLRTKESKIYIVSEHSDLYAGFYRWFIYANDYFQKIKD